MKEINTSHASLAASDGAALPASVVKAEGGEISDASSVEVEIGDLCVRTSVTESVTFNYDVGLEQRRQFIMLNNFGFSDPDTE